MHSPNNYDNVREFILKFRELYTRAGLADPGKEYREPSFSVQPLRVTIENQSSRSIMDNMNAPLVAWSTNGSEGLISYVNGADRVSSYAVHDLHPLDPNATYLPPRVVSVSIEQAITYLEQVSADNSYQCYVDDERMTQELNHTPKGFEVIADMSVQEREDRGGSSGWRHSASTQLEGQKDRLVRYQLLKNNKEDVYRARWKSISEHAHWGATSRGRFLEAYTKLQETLNSNQAMTIQPYRGRRRWGWGTRYITDGTINMELTEEVMEVLKIGNVIDQITN